jgi:hypothetical protein
MSETPDNVLRLRPFIFAVDCSQSMQGEPIAAVNAELPKIIDEINSYPAIAELARVGMITFNHAAKVEFPISDPEDLVAPTLTASSITDYGAALDEIRAMLERDVPKLGEPKIGRPIVLFMTDGVPSDREGHPLPADGHEAWLSAWRRLQDPFPFRPHIACLGFGQATLEPLLMLANHKEALVKLDRGGDPAAAVRSIFKLVLETVITVTGGRRTNDNDFFDGLMGGGDDVIAAYA